MGDDNELRPAAKLAIGLVPTWRFLNNNGVQVWSEFNGSVIVDITRIGLSALHRRPDTSVEVETPSFNNSWYAGNSDPFRDSFMASDDSLYVLSVEDLPGSGFGSTLTRIGLRGEAIWSRTWTATERLLGHSVAATPNNVYVIGTMYGPWITSNVGLYALDIDSDDLWNKTLHHSASDYPGDVGVNSEGEIYVGVSTVLAPVRNILTKFDSSGEILWERYFGATQWDRVYDVEVCESGYVYTRTENQLSLWDNDGNCIWSRTGHFDDAYVLENGNVLSVNQAAYGTVNLTCYNMDGEREWSSIYGLQYTQDWWDYVTITSAVDGPNETIFALLWIYGYHPGRLLLQFDNNGHQILNRTLSFSENLYTNYDILQYVDMYMDSNGLLYFVGEHMNLNFDNSIVIGVYDFTGVVSDLTNSVLVNTSIAFVLVTVVMVGYEVKRRIQHSE
jgi:hypothetical protein